MILNIPEPRGQAMPIMRGARRIARAVRRYHMEPALSWLLWLMSIVLFAFWTLPHYHAPAAPPWIGMTIHTTVFAIWMLVVREWLLLRFFRRLAEPSSRQEEDR